MAKLKNSTYGKPNIVVRKVPILPDNIEAPSPNKGNKLIKDKQAKANLVGRAFDALHDATSEFPKIGKALDALEDIVTNPLENEKIMQLSVGPLNKLHRAKLIMRRMRPMEKVPYQKPLSTKLGETTRTNQAKKEISTPLKESRRNSKLEKMDYYWDEDGTTLKLKSRKEPGNQELIQKSDKKATTTDIKNKVTIVNVSASPYIKLELQGLPLEVEFNPETSWSSVKSMGRNNPYYIYTGAEDTLTFEVTWYANDPNSREDVINKCKLLESWSKADGYAKSPPLLNILWGNSGIFSSDNYVLHQAKYKLSNFQNANRTKDRSSIVDGKLLPNTAVQSLVFKKVTADNQTSEQIISSEKIKTTKGITQ